jgi:hypothetical protein
MLTVSGLKVVKTNEGKVSLKTIGHSLTGFFLNHRVRA